MEVKLIQNNSITPKELNRYLENWKEGCIKFYTESTKEFINIRVKEYKFTRENLERCVAEIYNPDNQTYIIKRIYSDEYISHLLSEDCSDFDKLHTRIAIKQQYMKEFRHKFSKEKFEVIFNITSNTIINHEKLNLLLDKEINLRKEQLINEIQEVAGDILELKDFGIKEDENRCFVKGSKCNAMVDIKINKGNNIRCCYLRVFVIKV